MKVNYVGYSAGLKLFLGILLAGCFLATAAHADSLFTGTFTLGNEVHWGKAVLPPGAYSLAIDATNLTIIIRNAQTGKIVALENARPGYSGNGDDSKLLIAVRGNQRAVYSVQLAGLGEVFQTVHPFPAGRRAAEEARNVEAIPVQVTQK
jgi:hypothetical protein